MSKPAIAIEDLTFRYTPETPFIIKSLNLAVEKGRTIGLVGPNGSGKTSLALLLAKCLKPSRGRLLIDGRHPADVRRAFVFQQYSMALFPWLTLRENIVLPGSLGKNSNGLSQADIHARGKELLSAIGMEVPLDRFPAEVSGGQRQIVHVVQALTTKPEFLVLDEPFSALDINAKERLMALLRQESLENPRITLLISHAIETVVGFCDVVLCIRRPPIKRVKILPLSRAESSHSLGGITVPDPKVYETILRLVLNDEASP